jgi:osmotically-inducible protein OsmY
MKNLSFRLLLAATLFVAAFYLPACKGKPVDSQTNTLDSEAASQLPDTTVMSDQPAATGGPVVASDEALTTSLKDATKDFPGVTATVNNGEVTLTGEISRDRLPKLMQSVNALQPKKVNNNLTIK